MSKVETRFHFRNRAVLRARPCSRVVKSLVAGGALLLSLGATAQNVLRPETLIKWRQSAFQVIAWNSGRLKNALAGQYDSQEIQSAANALAAVANSGLPALFAPGTENGKGWRETTAREAAFSDAEKFRTLTSEFAREANALARLAATDDRRAVAQQFLKVAQTCKSCHDKFRQID
jgi:cytochrome c556